MEGLAGLRVCRFGRFDPTYSRNRIVEKCLHRLGATVVDVIDPRPLVVRTPALLRRALALHFDLILVGFRAHSDASAASFLARLRRVPLVFDPLISRYDEKVVDRELVSPRTPLAWWYFATDKLGCRLADRVLLDTDAHITHFSDTFKVPRSRFRRLWLGADDEVVFPRPRGARDEFTVFFYGRYGPLQGVEQIIEAASILERRGERVHFVLVGTGQTYRSVRALAEARHVQTVTFLDPVPYARLAELMGEADVCLGIFGTTAKAQRVIPNKVFDGLAAGRAVVTADTPAAREALVHGEHAWLCPPGGPIALADALLALRRDQELRHTLATNGHRLFQERFSIAALSRDLADILVELTASRDTATGRA